MHTGLSKPFRHINMPLYHLKNPVDLELMADKIIQSCTGDQSLYIVDAFQQICLPAAIQLRKNIIQQKHRCIPDLFLHQIDLRKLQGKGRSPLLPLGTIPPDVDPVDLYAEIISVRSHGGQLHPKIPLPVPGKLILKLRRRHTWLVQDLQLLDPAGSPLAISLSSSTKASRFPMIFFP